MALFDNLTPSEASELEKIAIDIHRIVEANMRRHRSKVDAAFGDITIANEQNLSTSALLSETPAPMAETVMLGPQIVEDVWR